MGAGRRVGGEEKNERSRARNELLTDCLALKRVVAERGGRAFSCSSAWVKNQKEEAGRLNEEVLQW